MFTFFKNKLSALTQLPAVSIFGLLTAGLLLGTYVVLPALGVSFGRSPSESRVPTLMLAVGMGFFVGWPFVVWSYAIGWSQSWGWTALRWICLAICLEFAILLMMGLTNPEGFEPPARADHHTDGPHVELVIRFSRLPLQLLMLAGLAYTQWLCDGFKSLADSKLLPRRLQFTTGQLVGVMVVFALHFGLARSLEDLTPAPMPPVERFYLLAPLWGIALWWLSRHNKSLAWQRIRWLLLLALFGQSQMFPNARYPDQASLLASVLALELIILAMMFPRNAGMLVNTSSEPAQECTQPSQPARPSVE